MNISELRAKSIEGGLHVGAGIRVVYYSPERFTCAVPATWGAKERSLRQARLRVSELVAAGCLAEVWIDGQVAP